MRGLRDKRVIVAGSARGIGAGVARRLASEGARLILGDIDMTGVASLAAEIVAAGGEAVGCAFDLHDEQSIKSLIVAANESFGGVDAMVNVAYEAREIFHGRDFEITEMSADTWAAILHANVIGTALCMKYAIPAMIGSGGGSVVNLSSGAAWVGEPIRVAYGVSKAGINSMMRHAALRYGPQGVRVNCVSPGAVLTEAGREAFSADDQQRFLDQMPIKRLGAPDDIAGVVAFLLSDDARWITGQVWSVNGGAILRE